MWCKKQWWNLIYSLWVCISRRFLKSSSVKKKYFHNSKCEDRYLSKSSIFGCVAEEWICIKLGPFQIVLVHPDEQIEVHYFMLHPNRVPLFFFFLRYMWVSLLIPVPGYGSQLHVKENWKNCHCLIPFCSIDTWSSSLIKFPPPGEERK